MGGIRARLIGLSLGIVLPFFALAAALAWQSVESEVSRLRQSAVDEARERASDVDMLISAWRQTLEVLAHTPALREQRPDEASQIFGELVRTYPYLSNAGAVDASRTIWASALPQLRGLRITGEQGALMREAFERGQATVSAPVSRAAGRNQPVSEIFLRQPIRDSNAQIIGVVQIGLPFETLQTALGLETMTPSAVVLILSEDGTVLTRSAGLDEAESASFLNALATRPPQGQNGVVELRDDGGQDWLLAYQRATTLPWYAAVVQPRSEAYAPARRIAQSTLLTVICVLLLSLFISRRLGLGIVRPIQQLALASRAIGRREFDHRVPVLGDREIRQVASAFNQMTSELEAAYRDLERRVAERTSELEQARKDLQRLNSSLQETVAKQVDEINRIAQLKRYLSPQVADALISDHELMDGPTHRRHLTVMFADLRGFTALSETLEVERLVELLNAYLAALTEAVFNEGGTLDKYLGDGLMAFFGDPMEYPDHADRAVRAALAMQRAIEARRSGFSRADELPLAIGVGITSGTVTVGTIGSSNRLEYTVVGNNVNLAARLTSLAGPGEILCDEATAEAVSSWAAIRNRGPDIIKGRREPVTIYQILGVKEPLPQRSTQVARE